MGQDFATLAPTCRFATSQSEGDLLCHCAQVPESVVQQAVTEDGVDNLAGIIKATEAGSGCTACHCRINRVLQGLPAKCGGRFDLCHGCGCISAICVCEAA